MTSRLKWFGPVVGLMLLLLMSVAVVSAQQEDTKAGNMLTGTISGDAQKGWTLIEEESGDSVMLKGSVKFADYVGTRVIATGKWSEDGKYFEVSRLDKAPKAGPAPGR
jgi:hypothetical protein